MCEIWFCKPQACCNVCVCVCVRGYVLQHADIRTKRHVHGARVHDLTVISGGGGVGGGVAGSEADKLVTHSSSLCFQHVYV